jgi:hypothetical protein
MVTKTKQSMRLRHTMVGDPVTKTIQRDEVNIFVLYKI